MPSQVPQESKLCFFSPPSSLKSRCALSWWLWVLCPELCVPWTGRPEQLALNYTLHCHTEVLAQHWKTHLGKGYSHDQFNKVTLRQSSLLSPINNHVLGLCSSRVSQSFFPILRLKTQVEFILPLFLHNTDILCVRLSPFLGFGSQLTQLSPNSSGHIEAITFRGNIFLHPPNIF